MFIVYDHKTDEHIGDFKTLGEAHAAAEDWGGDEYRIYRDTDGPEPEHIGTFVL
jgi:hypothetical protein